MIKIDEGKLKEGVLGLVMAVVEIIRDALQNQATHRMESGRLAAEEIERLGQALADLERDPERIGVVLFARPYNGFVEEAHKGIPHKFASRGIMVIPLDFLRLKDQPSKRHMYWGMGQRMMAAARLLESRFF